VTATVSAPRTSVEKNSWPRDFALGVRLAVGGGRTSWMRLILGTIGIGLAVAVLLVFASFGNIMHSRDARTNASDRTTKVVSGVSPTQYIQVNEPFQGNSISGAYVHGTGPNSPVPPGITSLPGPNQIVLSPALADLLNSDDGARLRPRFPQRIVGTIGEAGMRGPSDLMFYAGTGPLPTSGAVASNAEMNVYAFGKEPGSHSIDPTLMVLAIIGAVALLIPIFIFVSVSSRIAGAERDRRLAALRLVGAGNWQVRRIAAAESLVSAGTGLVLGGLAFLGIRALAPQVDVLGWSTFSDDVVPSLPLALLIVLLVPVLSVGTVLFAMRRTIIEPLGVVRGGKPVRRRVWWRLGLIVLGVVLLFLAKPSSSHGSNSWVALIAGGSSALLIGVPAILPWLLERIISRVQGGAPSWQLAIRRLQLDSGTPARVVGGVAVVLAGAIALQLMLFATANRYNVPNSPDANDSGWVLVGTTASAADQVDAQLTRLPAAKRVDLIQTVNAIRANGPDTLDQMEYSITIASCQSIQRILHVSNCVDGQSFLPSSPEEPVRAKPGDVWSMFGAHDMSDHPKLLGSFTVPDDVIPLRVPNTTTLGPYLGGGVVLTPGAAAGLNLPTDRYASAWVLTDPNQVDAADQIANGLAAFTWQVNVDSLTSGDVLNADQKTFVTIRSALLAGSLFTLLLAGVSMLVLALEQVRERRRPLAVLAAAGVPRTALGRSLLWQTAIPVVLAVVVAVGTGIGLAALVIRMTSLTLQIDWFTIGIFACAALVLVLLVTGLTLPALRSAMRLSALRTE
jgi:hypothetical protein